MIVVTPLPTPARSPALVRRDSVALILAALSGGLDAMGIVVLGGAFTSVMTGNLVLSGVAVAGGNGRLLGRVAAAIGAYTLGCWGGARLSGRANTPEREVWPASVSRTLLVEFALLAAFAVGWWSSGSHPSAGVAVALLASNAAALGLQGAAVLRFGVPGLSTTYLTGTLTTLVVRLAHRQPLGEVQLNALLIAALLAGGVGGAALAFYARWAVPVLPLALLAIAVLAGRRLHQRHPV